jgi:ATP-binding cassette subfamily B protein
LDNTRDKVVDNYLSLNQLNSFAKNIWKKFLLERWGIYAWGGFSVLMTNLMQILAPKNIGWIIDFLTNKPIPKMLVGENSNKTFLNLFLVLVISRVLINIFRFFWRITLGRQTHYACAMLRRDVWEHASFFKKIDLDNKFTKGVLMNAEASDSNSARFIFGFTLVAIFDVAFLGVFTFLTMAAINLEMAILSFLLLLFVPILVRNLSQKEVDQYRIIQDALSRFNDLSSQAVSTIKLQRLTQTGLLWEKRLMDIAEIHRKQKLIGINLSLLYVPLMGVASIFSYVILFVFGVSYTLKGKMTTGEFLAMQGLIFLLHDPLMSLGFIVSEWKKGFTALERLAEIYFYRKDSTLLIPGQFKINDDVNPVIEVKNLSFSYPNIHQKIINNFNLTIKHGERIGITGEIGSGKSTILSILSGLERDISSGEINFLGHPYNSYTHTDIRNYVSFVQQKPFLFADTIKGNIAMDSELSDEDIWHYLELAGLKSDVESFPNKLETQLGEWGINLSGGQKQRLTLARALAKKPKLLLLDDCLSAVDTITEETILKNLDKHLQDTTLVWVAHRKSTLKYCNQLFEMKSSHEVIQ